MNRELSVEDIIPIKQEINKANLHLYNAVEKMAAARMDWEYIKGVIEVGSISQHISRDLMGSTERNCEHPNTNRHYEPAIMRRGGLLGMARISSSNIPESLMNNMRQAYAQRSTNESNELPRKLSSEEQAEFTAVVRESLSRPQSEPTPE